MALSLAELERLRREQAILNAPIEAASQPGTQVSEMITPEGAELIPPKDYAWFNRKRGEEGIYATPPTIMDAGKYVIPFGRELAGEKPIDMDTAMEAVMWAPAIKPVAVIGKQVGKVIGRQIAKEAPELKAIAKNVITSQRGSVGEAPKYTTSGIKYYESGIKRPSTDYKVVSWQLDKNGKRVPVEGKLIDPSLKELNFRVCPFSSFLY